MAKKSTRKSASQQRGMNAKSKAPRGASARRATRPSAAARGPTRRAAPAAEPMNGAALRSVAAVEAANPLAPAQPHFIDVPSTAVGTAVQASVSVHHATRVTAEQISPGMFRVTRE